MEYPVQDSRGDHRVSEDLVPLREAAVGGQDQGPLLVAAGDELEEQMRAVTVDRDVADLVDDEELGLAVELQSLLDPVLGIGLGKGGDQRHGLGKVCPVALGDRLDAQGHGQVGLPDARRAQEDDVLAVRDEPALGQFLDPLLVDRGLEGEVEALEGLDVGELVKRGPDSDVLLLLGGHLLGEDLVQEVGVGDVVLGGFLESRLQTFVDPIKPEMTEVVLDMGEAHWTLPSTRLWYTARSRIWTSSAGAGLGAAGLKRPQ